MKIKNRFIRRMLWEIRRHAIIIAFYSAMLFVCAWLLCFVLTLPEIIGLLIFG